MFQINSCSPVQLALGRAALAFISRIFLFQLYVVIDEWPLSVYLFISVFLAIALCKDRVNISENITPVCPDSFEYLIIANLNRYFYTY